jgi:hypothetical protein
MTAETKILIILLLTTLGACTQDKKSIIYSNHQIVSNDYNPNASLLIGRWTMCSEGGKDGTMISYNVCPTIEFKVNGTTNFETNSEETKQWKVKKDTLYLSQTATFTSDSASWFTDLKYLIIKESVDANSINIKLKHTDKGYFSNLSKEMTDLYLNIPDLQGKSK